jgi:hypothetical protein
MGFGSRSAIGGFADFFVLILFRQKLIELLPWLELDIKGLKIRFRSAEEEAVKISLAQPALIESSATPEETSKFDEIAKLSPRVAVLELAYELEEAVRGFAGVRGIDRNTRTTTLRGLIRLLRSNNLIDQQTSALLDDLNAIGNTAKHGHEADLSKEDAVRFRNLAQIAINQLHIVTAAAQSLGQPVPLR